MVGARWWWGKQERGRRSRQPNLSTVPSKHFACDMKTNCAYLPANLTKLMTFSLIFFFFFPDGGET